MKARIFSFMVSLAICMSLVIPINAGGIFPDVTSPQYDWAKVQIEEMVEAGYIKGYTDKTFKPAQIVTKMEALIFASRVIGYLMPENKTFTDLSLELYSDALSDYNFGYKNEVAYLLYKGVLSVDELDYYLAADKLNSPMLRYDAAKLLTKLCDGSVSDDPSVSFKDAKDIPSSALPYVEYVVNSGLMFGVSDTEFLPKGTVTRAQIAVMLHRIIRNLDLEIKTGKITSVLADTSTIKYEDSNGKIVSITLTKKAKLLSSGIDVSLSKFYIGYPIAVIMKGEKIAAVETVAPIVDETVTGIVKGITAGSPSKIKVLLDETGDIEEYTIASGASITLDSKNATINAILSGYYVELDMGGSSVLSVHAEKMDKEISGTVEKIILEPKFVLRVRLSDDSVVDYEAQDDVTVKRNGKTATLRDILQGDDVDITLRYNKVYDVLAKSKNKTVEGTIEEIIISSSPSIKVKTSTGTENFALNMATVYTLGDSVATIYDLRLSEYVKLDIEGDTVVKVTSQEQLAVTHLTGVIESVSKAYNFFNLKVTNADGSTTVRQIFLKTTTKIINSADAKEKKIDYLVKGQMVTVTGSMKSGVYEATTIILLAE